jgi:hypothetical protein
MHDRRGHHSAPVPRLAALSLWGITVLAACGTTIPSPTPSRPSSAGSTPAAATALPTPTVTPAPPSAAATSASAAPPCTVADLKASHGIVEGAAGSRVTEVLLVSGVACSVDAFPALGLRDANGAALVGAPSAGGGRVDLIAFTTYASAVRLANWCLPEPAFPLALQIRVGAEELAVTGGSFPNEGDMPPCNGEGAPILEGGPWTAQQP